MPLREKQLYHQAHPLKLATDISAQIVSSIFLWFHNILLGIPTMLAPSIIVSGIMVATMDFTWIKRSAVGRYLAWEMTAAMQAVRLVGALPFIYGAWTHQW